MQYLYNDFPNRTRTYKAFIKGIENIKELIQLAMFQSVTLQRVDKKGQNADSGMKRLRKGDLRVERSRNKDLGMERSHGM